MQRIEQAVECFQAMVETGDEPPPDFVRDAELVIQIASTATAGKEVDLSADNYLAELCAKYTKASAEEKAAETAKKALKAEILTKIGDAAKVKCGVFSISAGNVSGTADK